jgi:hypothetical protein
MRAPVSPSPSKPAIPVHRTGLIDYNRVLRHINTWLDAGVAPLEIEDYAERQQRIKQAEDEFRRMVEDVTSIRAGLVGALRYLAATPQAKLQCRSDILANLVLSVTSSAFGRVDSLAVATVMQRRLTEIAFALAIWHAENGTYPADLAALVPTCLDRIPSDLFTGKHLVYKPGQAGYLLYSVGMNGQDDGGVFSHGSGNADDIVVRAPTEPMAPGSQP